jgi:histidinol-phosphate aminotransferase
MQWRTVLGDIPDYHPGKNYPDSVKLSSNENPLGPSPRAIGAMHAAVSGVSVYPPMIDREVNEAIAVWRGGHADQVITGNGSDEVFLMASSALIESGLNAVGSEHSFSMYEAYTRIAGGEYRKAPMKDMRIDLDGIAELIDEDTRIAFLCSPNNPTGRTIDLPDLERFLDRIPESVLVVVDHAYREYADDPEAIDAAKLLPSRPNLLVTGTFSKLFGLAALRFGYALASPEVVGQLRKVKSPFNNNSLALASACAAMQDEEFFRRSLAFNRESRERFTSALKRNGIGFIETQANFVCVESPGGDAARSVELLQRQGITVRNLASFGLPAYLRITLGDAELMERIADILGGR